jgi:hypothetical protein
VENFWELKRKLYGQDFVSQSVDTVPYALGECVVVCCCCFVVSCEFVKSKKKEMRVKMRENWDSIRQSVTKWPNSVRLSIAQAIQERRQEAEDPNHSKIFTFAWPSASSSSSSNRSSTTRSKDNRSATATSSSSRPRCTFRRCWTQLQRLLFDEEPVPASPSPPGRTIKTSSVAQPQQQQQAKMASKATKAAQPVVHKVIMVGSGGVGKSALTLQFMYDEVRTIANV